MNSQRPGFFKRVINYFRSWKDSSASIYSFDDLISSVLNESGSKLTASEISKVLNYISENLIENSN